MRRTAKFVVLPLLVLGFAFLLRASIPHIPTGTWQAGNPMAEARSGAASVLLSSGSVLITGGDGTTGTLNTAEVMSNAGIFSSVASMQSPRSGHTATALQDGRVLITGGTTATGGGATNSAEVYDPSANSWTLVNSAMLAARTGHTASPLPDGRVLLTGGSNSGGPVSTLEIFDPSSDSFSGAGVLGSPVSQHAAATLADGRVLIAGGSDGTNALATTYLFDPSSSSITSGPNLSSPRVSASATTLLDGTVLVAGGNDGSNDLASAEIYDPAANTFSPAPSNLAVPRSGHRAFLLPNNNSVLILGGTSAGTDLASVELYLPWTGNFQTTAAMSDPRPRLTASPLSVDGVLTAAGGSNLLSTELYGFATVKTDQADYAPGSIVTITGSGWKPGETVTLTLVESPLIDTHPMMTAVADASGNIFNNQFVPDLHDINVKFYLTAVGSQSGVQAENTFTDAKPNMVTLSPASFTVLPGSTATYTVTVDFNGNQNSCTSPLSLTFTAPAPVGANPTFNPSLLTSTGGSLNSTLTITTANNGPMSGRTQPGTYPFTVTAGNGAGCQAGTATANGTLVVAGPATGLSVTGYPSQTTAGTSQNFTVTALDANGNTAIGYTGTVHFTSSDSQAVLPANYTFVAADKGMHIFSATLETAGTQSITATDTVTGTITGTQNGIAVNAAATSKLLVAGYPSPVTAGTSNSFTVTATDAFGNLTAGYTGTVHFTSSDGAATLPANYNFTTGNNKDNGTHTFSATLNTAGTQSITATDTGTASINGTQSGITVNASTVNTTTTVASSLNPSTYGSSVTFTATVTRSSGSNTPTGTVAIKDGSTTICTTGNLSGSGGTSSASCSVSNLSVTGSPHSITAGYGGDSNFNGSTSNALSQTVTTRTTSTTISPLTASTPVGVAATFNITVKDTDSGPVSNAAGTVAVTSSSSPANTDSISACSLAQGANPAGTVSCQVTVTPTTPFAIHTINASFTATNSVHANSSTTTGAALTVFNPDTKPPVVTVSFALPDGQNGWFVHSPVSGTVTANDTTTGNSNVTAITCTDGVNPLPVSSPSGIDTPSASGSLSVSGEGTHNISCQATDSAGNGGVFTPGSTNTATVKIDTIAPSLTATRLTAANANGWNNTDVSVRFACADSTSLVASINATGAATGSSPTSPLDVTVSTEGMNQAVNGSCKDNAGNAAVPQSVIDISIDKTKPVITGSRNPAANGFGWNNTNVTVSFACAETGAVQSGIDTNSAAGQTVTGEVENLSVSNTGSCTDLAGNAADSATVSGINIDKTAPNAPTAARTPAANGAGWNNTSPVSVSFTSNGDVGLVQSGIDTCTDPSNVTGETAGSDVNGTCTDKAGNSSAPFKVTVKIDLTKPVITGNRSPAPNLNGWNNVNVTVGFACAETGTVQSGIANDNVAGAIVSTEGANQSVTNTGGCADVAGNAADSATVININIDKTKPTASAARDVPPNAYGWNNTNVTVTFSGNDSSSGIAGCDTPVTVSLEGINQSASGSCKDKADNVSDAASVTGINIDKTKPVITGSRTPLANSYGWNNTDVTVSFTCADAGSVQAGIATNTAAGATLSGEGAGQSVPNSGSCRDKADNDADPQTVSGINIDKTNPTITLTITPGSPAVTGWYNISTGPPTVSFTCNDSLAGVASCTPPVLVGEGANQTISGAAMDKAGNSASTSIMHVNVDVTAPTVNLINPSNSGSYVLNQSAIANYGCADAGSSGLVAGSAGCGGPVASGAQFDTASVGSKNFTVNAKDVAGNTYSKTSLYGVFYSTAACLDSPGHAILQPIDLTGASVFPKKQGSTVPAKFRVCDANGVSIGTPGVVTDFKVIQIYNGTLYGVANEDPVSTTPDTMFRWTGDQWMFNISTKPLNAGSTYFYRISLNDGTSIDFDFGLR